MKSKQRLSIEKMMKTAPFVRLYDKCAFVLGTLIITSSSYMLGGYPRDHYYTFYIALVSGLIGLRFLYYRTLGWHYYLTDFCYYANVWILLMISMNPKSA
jgi:hypothetical protein